jgi:hypothetical protein
VPVPVPVPVPARARSAVQSARHVDEHGDDADEELARGLAARRGDELEPYGDVENGGALGRGAPRDPIEASLLGLGELARAFGDVQDDGGGSSAELVGEVTVASGEAGGDAVGEREEVHCGGVDVESFVIEVHESAIDHGCEALHPMSNHTLQRLKFGDAVSIGLRRMIERIFGWMKTTANFRRTRLRGLAKTTLLGTLVGAAYNILRLARLTHAAA